MSPPRSSHSSGATWRRRGRPGAGGPGETDRRSDQRYTGHPKVTGSVGWKNLERRVWSQAGWEWEQARVLGLTQAVNHSPSSALRPKLGKTQPVSAIGPGSDTCLHGDSRWRAPVRGSCNHQKTEDDVLEGGKNSKCASLRSGSLQDFCTLGSVYHFYYQRGALPWQPCERT